MRASLITNVCDTPDKLKGREFESLILKCGSYYEQAEMLTIGRYGVQVLLLDNQWTPQSSLPDFEGVVAGGRQFIIEAKVCSIPGFNIGDETHLKKRQYSHMARRSKFGVSCYLLIHFNRRELKTKTDEAFTTAFPVDPQMEIWQQYEQDGKGRITREHAREVGIPIRWGTTARGRTIVPDLHFLRGPQN